MTRVLDLTGRAQQIYHLASRQLHDRPIKPFFGSFELGEYTMTFTADGGGSNQRMTSYCHIRGDGFEYTVIRETHLEPKKNRVRLTELVEKYYSQGSITPEQITKLLLVL